MPQVEIHIKGKIDEHWSDWFKGLMVKHVSEEETVLTGPVADQSALYGLLARLRDLGLTLLSVSSEGFESPGTQPTRKDT